MSIIKHVFQFTVLRRRDDPLPDPVTLKSLHYEICSGPMIGGWPEEIEAEELDDEARIKAELFEIGNDGTFFDDDYPDYEVEAEEAKK